MSTNGICHSVGIILLKEKRTNPIEKKERTTMWPINGFCIQINLNMK